MVIMKLISDEILLLQVKAVISLSNKDNASTISILGCNPNNSSISLFACWNKKGNFMEKEILNLQKLVKKQDLLLREQSTYSINCKQNSSASWFAC